MVLNLRTASFRDTVGVDFLSITLSRRGNKGLLVVVNMFSKYAALYPVAEFTAEAAATALLHFYTTFGSFSFLRSDPGSHFTADTIVQFNKLFGMAGIVSITDVHTSCGVESTNGTVLMYLKGLVHDLRQKDDWDNPATLPLIAHALNSEVHEETGYPPNVLMFGTLDAPFFDLPQPNTLDEMTAFIAELNQNLIKVRAASAAYQSKRALARTGSANDSPNSYQPGDMVLWRDQPQSDKLDGLLGPFEVIGQVHNTVTVRHLVSGKVSDRHVSRLKIFSGTREAGYEAALRDSDQYRWVVMGDDG
jgi:hypothetical protein